MRWNAKKFEYAGSFFGAELSSNIEDFNQDFEFKIYVYSAIEGLELDVLKVSS